MPSEELTDAGLSVRREIASRRHHLCCVGRPFVVAAKRNVATTGKACRYNVLLYIGQSVTTASGCDVVARRKFKHPKPQS